MTSFKSILKGLFMIGFIALVSQCKKDRLTVDSQSPTESKDSSLGGLFSRNAVESQYFSIDQSTAVYFTGKNGIEFYIPKNTFVDANNNVISGVIEIELKEILDVKSMVLSNMPTTSNGELLESGGEFYIKATYGGNELFISNPIMVSIPTSTLNANMEVFVYADSTWNLSDSSTVSPVQDSLENKYEIWLDSIDYNYSWINCDDFPNEPNLTNVKADISPDSIYSDTNTVVFMVIPSMNAVYNMSAPDPFTAYNIPQGKVVTFLSFSYYNNTFYFGYKENVTIVANHLEPLPLKEMSEADMLLLLDQIL